MTISALEFYSGIGGLHCALERSDVDAQVVRAFDWDQLACRVYDANYGKGIVKKTDISTLDASEIRELNAPLWLLSPSCQPYTVLNPEAKGAKDPRARSFLHLVERVIPDLAEQGCAPRWILIENVAGFETSSTRRTLLNQLAGLNYSVVEFLLTPLQFGIPNSRLRYYLLAKLLPSKFTHSTLISSGDIMRHIPGEKDDWVDDRETVGNLEVQQVGVYLDKGSDMDFESDPRKIPDKVLEKWGRLFDIVLPSSRRTCCFTRGYTQLVERAGSILQSNEGLDTTSTFDNFLAAQACTHADSVTYSPSEGRPRPVHILYPLKLRYFSPSELLRIFHFTPPAAAQASLQSGNTDRTFVWPIDTSEKSKYRLLGNSVNVEVVRRLINYLFEGDIL